MDNDNLYQEPRYGRMLMICVWLSVLGVVLVWATMMVALIGYAIGWWF